MKTPSITIGISAFNEECNIAHILTDLIHQHQVGFEVKKIIVISDGSTDSTVQKAKSVSSRLIQVLSGRRQGKAARLVQILRKSKGITVILDADTRLTDKNFISKLVFPVISGQADLTSASQAETPPQTFVEKVLYTSMLVLNNAYAHYNHGDNFFTCHGQARAFSAKLSKKLRIPQSSGEDLYTYLYCKQNGFKYEYVPEAVTHYRLPTELNDHFRQSSRFVQSIDRIKDLFPYNLIEHELKLPLGHIAKYAFLVFLRYPLYMLAYIAIFIYSRIIASAGNYLQDAWAMSGSSKSLSNL